MRLAVLLVVAALVLGLLWHATGCEYLRLGGECALMIASAAAIVAVIVTGHREYRADARLHRKPKTEH